MNIHISVEDCSPYKTSRLVDEIQYLLNTFKVKSNITVVTKSGVTEEVITTKEKEGQP